MIWGSEAGTALELEYISRGSSCCVEQIYFVPRYSSKTCDYSDKNLKLF